MHQKKQLVEFEDFLIFHECGIPLYYQARDDKKLPLNDPVLKGGFLSAMMQLAKSYSPTESVLYDFGLGLRRIFLIYQEPFYFAVTLKKINNSTKHESMERIVKIFLKQVRKTFHEILNNSCETVLHDETELERFKKDFNAKLSEILSEMHLLDKNTDN